MRHFIKTRIFFCELRMCNDLTSEKNYLLFCSMFVPLSWHKYTECGPSSSVGIATDYGLDGPGSNPGGDEIFRPSRPALGPTQPLLQ